jgi:hypothetical protein
MLAAVRPDVIVFAIVFALMLISWSLNEVGGTR